MFLVMIDKKTNDYAFMEIYKKDLISVKKLNLSNKKDFDVYISGETDDEKLIKMIEEKIKQLKNKKENRKD